jgi:hypothetical protein
MSKTWAIIVHLSSFTVEKLLANHPKATRQALTRLPIIILVQLMNIPSALAHTEVEARLRLWLLISGG